MKQYAVVGNPVLHSLSPLIHQRAFDYYGISARYFAYEVQDFVVFMDYFRHGRGDFVPYSYLPSDLPIDLQVDLGECEINKQSTQKQMVHSVVNEHPLYAEKRELTPYRYKDFSFPMQGLSITIPHKKAVLACADKVSYRAKLAGAANTLYVEGDLLVAENTDIAGFFAPLQKYCTQNGSFSTAIVYGAGGAASAVLTALLHIAELEKIYICARREEQAVELITHMQAQSDILEQEGLNTIAKFMYLPLNHEEFSCDLVVNTIPQWKESDKSPRKDFTNVRYAYDLTYKETAFLRQAKQFDCHIQDGKTMFIEQAKAQFRLWTGLELPVSCYADLFVS